MMNEFDIETAVRRHTANAHPNRLGAALAVRNLADWANDHSDGWAYWAKPRNASKGLQQIADVYNATSDVTDKELALAARAVKAFCTRMVNTERVMSPDDRDRILRNLAPIPA